MTTMMFSRIVARLRSLLRGVLRRGDVEAEMAEEFGHHLQLRTDDLVREGFAPDEAARRARLEFGHVDGHKADARSSRGLAFFDQIRFSALDVRLGMRMLVKFPGLSVVAVTGMSIAIAIGAGVFSIMASLTETTLPLPGGDRLVAVRNANITESGRTQTSLRDFLVWREELRSVQDLAAFATTGRNLSAPGAGVEVVRVVRMTASGFRIARTAPTMGRPLLEEDERGDARVVVIGFEEWQRRFAADPDIIGRRVGLGGDAYTIVGVMPEGFRFPVDDRYWIPFVISSAERDRSDPVPVTIAGRLADGATLERAQVELDAIGARMAASASSAESHERLRPQVLSYTRAFFGLDGPADVRATQLFVFFVSLLLVVVAVNVAILVYARTATRLGEIAVRTALGASRTRVVAQLFAEALVLSGTAAVAGLGIASAVLAGLQAVAEHEFDAVPFWVELGLSPGVIAYVLVLAVVGAAIVGLAPALKVTGRAVQTSLQQLSGRGARMKLGRVWTALIVVQVAVAVGALPYAMHFTEETIGLANQGAGYATEEFLEASLAMDQSDARQATLVRRGRSAVPRPGGGDTSAAAAAAGAAERASEQRFRARTAELIRRLESDPAVAGLTILPPSGDGRIQIEDVATPGAAPGIIAAGRSPVERVTPNHFALYDMQMLAGRAFDDADARAGTTVIVNQLFADYYGGKSLLGRRLRFRESAEGEPGPWLEIVGVVRDFEGKRYEPTEKIYLPADAAQVAPPTMRLAIRVRVSPATSFAPRLRGIAAAVDPTLQVTEVIGAAERHRQRAQFHRYVSMGATAVMLSALLLSAAGIYAMMSFTVARRRREIGIRSALGADPRRLLGSVFGRACAQLGAGIVFGMIGTVVLDRLAERGPVNDGNFVVVPVVAALMTIVGLVAAIGPARRGLSVQPTEALREE